MLISLTIKNVALIESAEIEFKKGLNVLSGETGSGKSMILEALNFVLGAKADKSLIKSGANECNVEAEFYIAENQTVKTVLDDFDIEHDDVLIIVRKFNADGKTSVKVNGESVTVNMLKRITATLVDVHGQSEHFHLLKSSNQLKLIDKYGGEEIENLKQKIKKNYTDYKKIRTDLDELGGDESRRLMRLDVLDYQISEIEKCALKENEEEELLEIKTKLDHQEKILFALNSARAAISEEGGVSDILSNAIRSLSTISELGQGYAELHERLCNAFSEIDDISDTAFGMIEGVDYSEYNPDYIESRLETIKNVKKKYGNSYEVIQCFLNDAIDERARLLNFNEIAENLLSKLKKSEDELYDDYCELSRIRKKYAKDFSGKVLGELVELGMKNASFVVEFSEIAERSQCKFDSPNGLDQPEFMFSANLGEPLKPLSNVISGGEMSRFMLAIKAQTAKYNDLSTFVFDEIDAGISGVIAKVVAEKFAKISKSVQIVAISHLPQISAMADNNLLISKTELSNKTFTTVQSLGKDEKIKEITRLVGGESTSLSAIEHAKELIESAEQYKRGF